MKPQTYESLLEQHFGYSTFREGQKEIIHDVLDGNDVLGILPTGTGKSLCYQFPAVLMEGTVLIISPLISLMIDQVKQLKQQGYKKVTAINSFLNVEQKREIFRNLDSYKLIYCSPEMLQNPQFLGELSNKVNVSLFVVDEAHCISQWGHEFRPDYLKLDDTLQQLGNPTLLALSATAPKNVQDDIMEQLGRTHMKKHIYPMDRENIAFSVEHVSHMSEKIERMKEILTSHPVPTMVYFSSRQWSEKAAYELSQSLQHLRIAFYHGGMDQEDRLLIQQQFMNDQLDVICCTSAFGMGVNKSNIRLVIHAHLPSQLESFIQEVGRAGRDGKQSVSLTFYSPGDSEIPKAFIEGELPNEEILHSTITFLYQWGHLKGNHVKSDEEMESMLEIGEIHWRFLRYQFEKHGMIEQTNIIYDKNRWKHAYEEIKRFIQERTNIKHRKLDELVHWLHQEDCLRKSLYQPFQHSLKSPTGFCCDRCDFQFNRWEVDKRQYVKQVSSWMEELKQICLQGEPYEMDKPGRTN
ncbi:RecQ family ATP-dependent DNA helicase [Pontibacillus yanchengensis]|uniref:ATP-dependent DNA helicase n=1 Tax=Pontibacillus yanchengensis Y32 TaxID=1385514 RepID=A0A0A2T912_9BACI|nr:ATP-dependent DNA helicase RecQ [Pontibacillus yanchengensis]KGP70873.1 ATP-dependent DNA helicase [Pontibacillus yanchengensis Y32]